MDTGSDVVVCALHITADDGRDYIAYLGGDVDGMWHLGYDQYPAPSPAIPPHYRAESEVSEAVARLIVEARERIIPDGSQVLGLGEKDGWA